MELLEKKIDNQLKGICEIIKEESKEGHGIQPAIFLTLDNDEKFIYVPFVEDAFKSRGSKHQYLKFIGKLMKVIHEDKIRAFTLVSEAWMKKMEGKKSQEELDNMDISKMDDKVEIVMISSKTIEDKRMKFLMYEKKEKGVEIIEEVKRDWVDEKNAEMENNLLKTLIESYEEDVDEEFKSKILNSVEKFSKEKMFDNIINNTYGKKRAKEMFSL